MVAEQYLGHALESACSAAGKPSSRSSLPGFGIVDTACTKTCIGKKQLKEWLGHRATWLRKNRDKFRKLGGEFLDMLSTPVTFAKSSTMYKFGAGRMKRASSIA